MTQSLISEVLMSSGQPVLSYEFFPPKSGDGLDGLKRVAGELKATSPDFVSVTHSPDHHDHDRIMVACEYLREEGFATVVPHITCAGASRDDLTAQIDKYYDKGYRNVVCLRGDPPRGETQFRKHPDGLAHANELILLIKKRHPDICCGAAGYPEVHKEALTPESDLLYLKSKVEAGASFIITQLFYDNRVYINFEKKCREWGIRAPIIPGLMPPVSLKQIQAAASLCKASLPPPLVSEMLSAGNDSDKEESAGIEWTVRQIRGLLSRDAPGIHMYISNHSRPALAPALTECLANRKV